jgi:hypothetical protein
MMRSSSRTTDGQRLVLLLPLLLGIHDTRLPPSPLGNKQTMVCQCKEKSIGGLPVRSHLATLGLGATCSVNMLHGYNTVT